MPPAAAHGDDHHAVARHTLRRPREHRRTARCSCSSFALAARDLLRDARRCGACEAPFVQRYFAWMPAGDLQHRRGVPARSALDGDDAGHHRRRLADPRLQRRLHAGRPGLPALLRVPEPVRLLHARAGARRELSGAVRRLGRRRALLLPADRLLVQRQGERGRRQEGVHRQPHRRLRVPGRDVPAVREPRHARLRRRRTRRAGLPDRAARSSRRSASSSSSAAPARARRSRSTSGCPTRWPARRRSPR